MQDGGFKNMADLRRLVAPAECGGIHLSTKVRLLPQLRTLLPLLLSAKTYGHVYRA